MKPITVPPSMSMSFPKSSGIGDGSLIDSAGCHSIHEGISPPAKVQKPTSRFGSFCWSGLFGLSG
jgi:hypothetical protein